MAELICLAAHRPVPAASARPPAPSPDLWLPCAPCGGTGFQCGGRCGPCAGHGLRRASPITARPEQPVDPTILADAAPALFALAKAALGSAVGAIIGGRLGWLWSRRERRLQRGRRA